MINDRSWENYCEQKRKYQHQRNMHRIGPAPKDEYIELMGRRNSGKSGKSRSEPDHIGSLDCSDIDSGVEEAEFQNGKIPRMHSPSKGRGTTAGSEAIVIYFSRMATQTSSENIDFRFLHSLICNGAAVNVSDKFGQTVMHEVARNWNIDVAKFMINYGADVNQVDKWGRSPLHLAAASNHPEMVEFLLNNGANPRARTYGENQGVIHYAAKYNAVASLKVLVEHRVDYNIKDYRQRTPLFVAAEMGRIDTARYLLDIGVAAGVFDDTGMSCVGFMVEKMPHVACEALNQFHDTDVGRRKDYFYLNYLDGNPVAWRKANTRLPYEFGMEEEEEEEGGKEEGLYGRNARLSCPTTPLELAVRRSELSVIMHPAMQQLIKTKWHLFGKYGASAQFIFHLSYVVIWTLLAVFLPRDGNFYENGGIYWRLPLEILSVVLTFYFIINILSNLEFLMECLPPHIHRCL